MKVLHLRSNLNEKQLLYYLKTLIYKAVMSHWIWFQLLPHTFHSAHRDTWTWAARRFGRHRSTLQTRICRTLAGTRLRRTLICRTRAGTRFRRARGRRRKRSDVSTLSSLNRRAPKIGVWVANSLRKMKMLRLDEMKKNLNSIGILAVEKSCA